MRQCTAAHLSRWRRIPGQLAKHHWYLRGSSAKGSPARRSACKQAGGDANGCDRGGLAQLCLLSLNTSLLWATARDTLLLARRLPFNPAAPQVCLPQLNWQSESAMGDSEGQIHPGSTAPP